MPFKGGDKTLRQMVQEFEQRGWLVEATRGDHLRWKHLATGAIVFSAQSPSCCRAYMNIRKQLERSERAAAT
jgi:predicted RNA binding protein YcfA (HicA-like mRNA interferase family)